MNKANQIREMEQAIHCATQDICHIKDKLSILKAELTQSSIIRVPDCIKIEEGCYGGDRLGIVFNDSKQTLYTDTDVWRVAPSSPEDFIPAQLIKIDPSETVEGGTYYKTDYDNIQTERTKINNYSKFIDGKHWYVRDNGTVNYDLCNYNHWYKVEPLEETE